MCSHSTFSIEESDFFENIASLGFSWPSYSMGLLNCVQSRHKTRTEQDQLKKAEESLSGWSVAFQGPLGHRRTKEKSV